MTLNGSGASATHTNAELTKRRFDATPKALGQIANIFAAKAKGALLWDVEGNEYIDFCSGIGVLNVGHNHPKVVEAIKRQADSVIHTCFHVAMYEEYVRLAERLNEAVPISGPCKTAFFNSGAEAGENAVKVCRAATGRKGVVGFERAFHGRTLLGMTLTGKVKPYSAGFGPFAPEVYRLPYEPFFGVHERTEAQTKAEAKKALHHLFNYHIEPEQIACVMMEPVLGEGGFFPVNKVALDVLVAACREHGILFISDEVQSGFARCGSMFAIESYGIEPDMVAMAKSLGGGMPISGITARAEIMDAPHVGGMGGTFGGNPLSCAAGNAVLDVIEEENLIERAQVIGEKVMSVFKGLESELDYISNARGLGAMCGIEFVNPETGAPDPEAVTAVLKEALSKGLLAMSASGNVIRTLMPLVITDDELDRGLNILAECVKNVHAPAIG